MGEAKRRGDIEVGGYVLIDFDSEGVPQELADKIEANGGLWESLVKVLPALRGVERVEQPSSGGLHIYLRVKDVADSERFLRTLYDRCWLAGYGWHTIGKNGQLLERSIIDPKNRRRGDRSIRSRGEGKNDEACGGVDANG